MRTPRAMYELTAPSVAAALGLVLAASLPLVPSSAIAASGGGGEAAARRQLTTEQMAAKKLESGRRRAKNGLEHERRAELASSPEERDAREKNARREFERAAADFEYAVEREPDLFEAWSELGFARRKLGSFDASLEAYDRALRLEPRYAPAIEYRGEAYLELGRLEEVKEAYMQLFASERELADELMTAMRNWLERKRSAQGNLDSGVVEAFTRWVSDRAEIAEQTARVGRDAGSRW